MPLALFIEQAPDRVLQPPLHQSTGASHPPIGPDSLVGGILITIHRLSQGGADRVAIHLANGFSRLGYPVAMAVLRTGGEGEEALLGLLDDKVQVSHAGAPMGSRHLELIRGRAYLRRLADEARPALVLASSNNMGLVTGLSRRSRTGSPRYAMKVTNPVVRPEDRTPLKRLYRRLLYGFVFSNFDRVLALSAEELRVLEHAYPDQSDKFRVATNPYVSAEMMSHDPPPKRDWPSIVTLARMMPQKRLDILLRAFGRVDLPGVRLTIVGDGPERPQLEQLARDLGIADRVETPGFVANPGEFLREADLLALSSDYEGLPAVVFEAFACNVPVVTTDSFVAARSLLEGIPRCAVVPIRDVDALAREMKRSLLDREQTVDLRARAAQYTFEAATKSHLDALRSLLTAEAE